jgi:glutaryl-CoA dehydrogenase
MLAGVSSSMTLFHSLSQLEDEGRGSEEQASLAKTYCTVSACQAVGPTREFLGGDGMSPAPRRSSPARAHARSTR